MTKKQISLYLVLGLLVGLFLTACAGIATGKIDIPGDNDVFVFGPVVDILRAPALDLQLHSPARLERPALMEKAVEAEIMTTHFCGRGDH